MKNSKRAERRHHNARLLKKRFKQEVRQVYVSHDTDMEEELKQCMVRAKVRVDTSVTCSCAMCGNPRRKDGFASVTGTVLTFQEIKAEDSFRDGLEEFEESA